MFYIRENGKLSMKAIKTLPKEELVKHINGAAICCCIMEQILKCGHNLWIVPSDLAHQAKDAQKKAQDRKDIGKEKRFVRFKFKGIRTGDS